MAINKAKPANEHLVAECKGMTNTGRSCSKWERFHKDEMPERWYCTYHRDRS